MLRTAIHLSFICLLAASTCLPSRANAHHSRAAYDTAVEVVLDGTVVAVNWGNPHVSFKLDVEDAQGASFSQEVEVGPLSTLQPLGLTRDAIVPGERVTVRANPNRRGPRHVVVGLELTKSNGEVFPLHVVGRSKPPPPAAAAASISAPWVPVNDEFMGIVRGSRDWPLTPSALESATRGGGHSQMECAPWPAPLLMALPMLRVIEATDTVVTFRFDWMNAVRTVRLDLHEHPRDIVPSLQGHSIGRWEGETLVIDSVGFTPHPEGAGFGVPAAGGKHLIERLTLSADRSRLDYTFTVEDPTSLTAPVTYSMQWTHRPDLMPSGDECDLEIARRFGFGD